MFFECCFFSDVFCIYQLNWICSNALMLCASVAARFLVNSSVNMMIDDDDTDSSHTLSFQLHNCTRFTVMVDFIHKQWHLRDTPFFVLQRLF